MPMTLAEFNRRFRIVKTSLFNWPRDLSKDVDPFGDCQDYAKTVKRIEGVKFPRAIVIRCWSPQNWKPPFLPRHAVLWIKGKGFIDSTRREYRKTPWPHFPAWPVGAPVLAVLALLWASPLRAETPQCATVNDALLALATKYAEAPRVSGLTSAGALMIVTASENGGFSVLLVSPDGLACMVASGANFEIAEAPKPGEVN